MPKSDYFQDDNSKSIKKNKIVFNVKLPKYIGGNFTVDLTQLYNAVNADNCSFDRNTIVLSSDLAKVAEDVYDEYTNITYLLDTIMLIHLMKKGEKSINQLRKEYLKLLEIIDFKWNICITAVLYYASIGMRAPSEEYSSIATYIQELFTTSGTNNHDVVENFSQSIFDKINFYRQEDILKIIYQTQTKKFLDSTLSFKCKFEIAICQNSTSINLKTILHKTWHKDKKCVAITCLGRNIYRYAISGMDVDISKPWVLKEQAKNNLFNICRNIQNALATRFNAIRVDRGTVADNPIYITQGNSYELTYQMYKESGKTGKTDRLLSCAERKLFTYIGNNHASVFVTVSCCEMCENIRNTRYPLIKIFSLESYQNQKDSWSTLNKEAEDIITSMRPSYNTCYHCDEGCTSTT